MKWLQTTIGDVCLPIMQCDPAQNGQDTFRYVDIAGIDRESKIISRAETIACSNAPSRARKIIQSGDILVSTVRPNLNAVAQVPDELDDAIASTGFAVLRTNRNVVDSRYLFYWTQHQDFINFLTANATGASYPAVSDGVVRRASLLLPPLSEQRCIVEILDEADRLRKLRRAADANAARILPAQFLKMFGDPMSNPKKWPLRSFESVCESRLGKMLDEKQQTGRHRRLYLRNANVQWNLFDLKTVLEMDFDPTEREELRLRFGDLLICEGGEVGRCAIWRDELPECYFQKALHRARPKPRESTAEYLLHLLWVLSAQGGLRDATSQVTIAHLTGVKLKRMLIPVPPFELQAKFSDLVQRTVSFDEIRWKCGKRIENLWDTTLRRAFSGHLTAHWRNAHMEQMLTEMEQQARVLNLSPSKADRLAAEA